MARMGCGLNRFVHEGMNHISNVKVHLKTRSGNVNIDRVTAGQVRIKRPSLKCTVCVKMH